MAGPAPRPRANVYVDGFNVYFGCLRDTPYRWLDLGALIACMFPEYQINRIRYFTARVKATPAEPDKPVRQNTYIRAVQTLPNLSLHLGVYKINKVKRELVTPLPDGTTHLAVRDPKEKGTDVGIATHLLIDGFQSDYDIAIVVSNDTDLCEPIASVRTVLKREIIVVAPCSLPERYPNSDLAKAASSQVSISSSDLATSQFPSILTDKKGTITKPIAW